MKFFCSPAVLVLTVFTALDAAQAQADLGDILKGAQKMLGIQGGLSENKITSGLKEAIKKMTFSDARKILDGRENEATLYFREKTYDRLSELFKPIIHQSMSSVGVTEKYQALESTITRLPMVGSERFELDQYVNDKALDGLFYILAQEEKKIREDPAARTTELLKEVFAKR
jgi:hypothetical protein